MCVSVEQEREREKERERQRERERERDRERERERKRERKREREREREREKERERGSSARLSRDLCQLKNKMDSVLGHNSALQSYTGPETIWANEMSFGMKHAPGAGSFPRLVVYNIIHFLSL